MPLYDYDCANCGRRSEVLRGVHSPEPTVCPLCGGGPLKKAFAAPAIHFKGSGWAKKERRATATPGVSKASGDGGSKKDGESSGSSADGGSSGSSGSSSGGDSASATSSESKSKASGPTADSSSSSKASSGSSGTAATGD